MSTLRKHLRSIAVSELAIPSNIKYGTAINERDGVEIITEKDDVAEFWVGGLTGTMSEGGGSKRRVQFWLEDNNLKWHCAGNPKNHDIFCKHCVAALLYLKDSPKK